ncbi:hypothetical protein [Curtobacterium poinsettiae]|uniref:hypothetical protein n=1 Tax=Curtobacterium poinsettiae TaxID=159612 RepID=UPI00217E2973|nr:hypothetical protein [Curtobacterium flaccumfaciens]MCS6578214.1 hypothetical protein [Curtobacterium flaccumfaciens]
MTRSLEELADCIRKGDDPLAVLRFAVRDAERATLIEAATYVCDELPADRDTRHLAKQLLLVEANKH